MKDFLIDENGDVKITNGDFAIGESSQQEVTHILTSFRGQWKNHYLIGGEIQRLLKARQGITTMKAVAREQLEMDGFKKVHFSIENNEINVTAKRNGTE